jgi:hypothetical protein
MAISVLLIQRSLPASTVLWQVMNLLLSIIVGAFIYSFMLWILGEVSPRQLSGLFSIKKTQAIASSIGDDIVNK